MRQIQIEKEPRPGFKVEARKGPRWREFFWELRQTCTWTWFLPLFIIVGSFLFTWFDYQANLHAPLSPLDNAQLRIKAILDYTNPLRNTLELLLPVVSIFLAMDLLIKEWRRNTLALLATRKPLLWFLAIRFGYLLGYLLLLNIAAILFSWWMTPHPPTNLTMWPWIWQTLLTIMAPTLLLMSLGLLIAHLSVNATAGYILPACCWLANWLYALQVEQSHQLSPILSYLLFGWSDQNLTPHPEAWFAGKIILCILGMLLLSLQPMILLRITLQHKEAD